MRNLHQSVAGGSATILALSILLSFLALPLVASDDEVFGDTTVRLRLGTGMEVSVERAQSGGWQPISLSAALFGIVLDGISVESFSRGAVTREAISGAFGAGRRFSAVGRSAGSGRVEIELVLTAETFDAYPGTILTHAMFRNLGTEELAVDAISTNTLLLDRRLVSPTRPPYDFRMLTLGAIWGNGEHDRIWALAADSDFDNYNGGDVTNPSPDFEGHWGGGGTPVTSVWSPEMAVTVAVVEKEIQVLGVPVVTQPGGQVRVEVRETNDLGTLPPGASVNGVRSSITVHSGDFFDGLAAYGGMMRDLGVISSTYSAIDYEAYWCSFGLDAWRDENPADRDLVEELLYIPEDLGLTWVNLDSGWENSGSCTVNEDVFADEQELVDWIDDLHSEGFKVSAWLDVGFGDEDELAEHPDWFIQNPDGSYFVDDWERNVMDPTLPEVQSFIEDCAVKLVTPRTEGGFGIDRFFLDGAFLPPPDYSGRHSSPHATERAGDVLYRILFETARSIVPDFPVECCGSGGVYNLWIQRYSSIASISDPDRMELRTQEIRTKIYKALFGGDAPVNGDHIEGTSHDAHQDMSYMFALNLGLGNVFQSYYWEDDWRVGDPLGLGDKALYQEWFARYDDLRLSEGHYLNLYDLAYDSPGSHAIAVGDRVYYLFAPEYDHSFSGSIELRGLGADLYEVVDYEGDVSLGTFSGPVVELDVSIPPNDPLLLVAVPTGGGSPCVPGPTNLCLSGGRFRVEVSWRDHAGGAGVGHVVPFGTDDSGLLWFFSSDNWEMLVKVLDGCGLNDRYWVFLAATTDVEYTLTVTDTETGRQKDYFNSLGVSSAAITDTDAFATCF